MIPLRGFVIFFRWCFRMYWSLSRCHRLRIRYLDTPTPYHQVHPDMSWSFLDESMFVTLLEVGVARGNLSKQSLVGALGAASKIVLQESQRRQMAENSHDRGRYYQNLTSSLKLIIYLFKVSNTRVVIDE